MKRLLQISLDTLLISILPIIMWILLGFIMTKEISNVFSLTYPLQFLFMIFVHLFGTGPNITAKRNNNESVIYSNMVVGIILVGIITFILSVNADTYINIMNMNSNIYHNFCIYSIVWMYLSFITQIIIKNLYYEGKNKESNKINLLLNLTNFILILFLSNILKDYLAITITLTIDSIIITVLLLKHFKRTKFNLMMKDNIKYTSFNILGNIGMLLIYSIGFGNSFSYGEKYATAINFECLTTDTQWDMLSSVDTASKIDLTKNNFNYKKSLKEAYQLLLILIGTTLLMNVTLYWYFKPNITILLIVLSVQIIDMLAYPLHILKWNYLQINDNNKKHNISYSLSEIIRLLCSFIPSAFCTYIGQVFSMIYLYVYSKIQCRKFKVFNKETVK